MKRFRKMVFGLVLTTAMMLQVTSVASASSSIQVNGHIEESGEPAGCHITYHSNGGTGGYEGPDIAVGGTDTVCTLSGTGITRSGYQFLNWNTAANGSGTSYTPGDAVLLNSDLTLYAQWKKEPAGTARPQNSAAGTGKTSGIKTGDTTNVSLWVRLSGVSLAGILFLFWISRRKKQHGLQES